MLENQGHDYSGALDHLRRRTTGSGRDRVMQFGLRPQPHPDDELARFELACDDHKEVDIDSWRQYLLRLIVHFFRLEAATSRLEDIASAQASGSDTLQPTSPASHRASAAPPAPPITQTLGSSRERAPVASSLGAAPDAVPASVSAFDERIIKTKLKNFLNLTKELGYGPLVEQVGRRVLRRRTPSEETQAEMVSNVFVVNRSIVLCAAACKKPNDAEMGRLLKPMMKDFDGISSIKDKNRSNKEFGLHFQVVADGIGCVGWIQLVSHLQDISIHL